MAARPVVGRCEAACLAGEVLVLLPLCGEWTVAGDAPVRAAKGAALLWSRRAPLCAAGSVEASALLLTLHRDGLNVAASRAFGDGRRLAQTAIAIGGSDLTDALDRLAQGSPDVDGMILTALVDAIRARADAATILAPVRAVCEAMQLVRDDPAGAHDIERLATRVAVTPQTLRKGFRGSLGLTVAEFVAAARLDWARGRLSCGRESSPVAVIARRAGFADSSHFARGYARRFGETPSQTRMKAVRMAA